MDNIKSLTVRNITRRLAYSRGQAATSGHQKCSQQDLKFHPLDQIGYGFSCTLLFGPLLLLDTVPFIENLHTSCDERLEWLP
jgi:hypothetical protein